VDGTRMVINVAQLLTQHGGGDFVTHIETLRVETHDHTLLVRFALRVRPPGERPDSAVYALPLRGSGVPS
jgi:hypothetical protein